MTAIKNLTLNIGTYACNSFVPTYLVHSNNRKGLKAGAKFVPTNFGRKALSNSSTLIIQPIKTYNVASEKWLNFILSIIKVK